MKYTIDEVMQYVKEEDVKFIRLAFCDVFGRQKNIAVMPGELQRVFDSGIAFDASAISGFGGEVRSDLFLRPDPSTLARLPWRPENGRVVRMFCDITHPDGSAFQSDTRGILKEAVATAKKGGFSFFFGSEMEFYLFKTDADGKPTDEPHDEASYMDIAPDDKGENVRREICLTLEQMGIQPESSHHEEGPGQNEIDFRFSDPLTAADNAITFRAVVKAIAARNGLWADFSPKPMKNQPGSGMHINISAHKSGQPGLLPYLVSGILEKAYEATVFLNPNKSSYDRLGNHKAPGYITWSSENRSQLIRIPAAEGEYRRVELRSADATANPYLAFALLIHAGLYGIENRLSVPKSADLNLYTVPVDKLKEYRKLPASLEEAMLAAAESGFIHEHLPEAVIDAYCRR
ncbi:MAG: glutamine synthetase [Clostridiales bacterium]|nr:glutamine synthetase [Clostridiales bacterium]